MSGAEKPIEGVPRYCTRWITIERCAWGGVVERCEHGRTIRRTCTCGMNLLGRLACGSLPPIGGSCQARRIRSELRDRSFSRREAPSSRRSARSTKDSPAPPGRDLSPLAALAAIQRPDDT